MAPKRQVRPSTPPPKKKAKKGGQQQTSIANFFISPSKPKQVVTNGHKRNDTIISIDDSDDDLPTTAKVQEEDEKLARKLAAEWGKEDGKKVDKGKAKASPTIEDDEEEDEVVPVDAPYSEATGINGSCSSKHQLPPIKNDKFKVKAEESNESKPIASIFASRQSKQLLRTPSPPGMKPDIKPILDSPSKTATITSISAEPVDPIDFDTDAFLFKPSEVDTSKWPKGRLPYSILVGVYVQVSSTRSRLLIVRVLTNFLHLLLKVSPIDLPPSLYLLSNHLLPNYLPCELGVGSQILTKAVMSVSGLQPRDLKKLWDKWGDPGDVAFEAKNNLRTLVKPSPLLVGDVYARLLGLSRVKGSQSGKIKGDVVRKLMVQARGEEVRFLVRSMVGNLRIGAVRLTLLTALARATALLHMPAELIDSVRPLPPPPQKLEKGQKRVPRPKIEPDPAREEVEERCVEATKIVRKVYVRHPNYGDLVVGLDHGGLIGLEDRVGVNVGIPLSPMLGSITRSLNEVFTRLGTLPFTAEAKLDGQRVQIHARVDGPQGEDDGGGRWVQGDEGKVWVRLFSRHLEDMTEKYPDVCQLILTLLTRPLPSQPNPFPSEASKASASVMDLLKAQQIKSFIMDAEIVAVDKDTGAYRTFQELSNRAKKDVRVEDIKVVVGVFAFDLMLLNDQPLLDSPFSHRRHLLRTLFQPFSNPSDPTLARFAHVASLDSTSLQDVPAEMQAFFESVVEQKCEGLMVKLLESGEGLTGEDDEDDTSNVGDTPSKKGKGKGGKRKPLPATYEPDQRSQGWLKVKKDYLEGLGDSLDLVPIGAWWGQGRKAGWWSPILLACHNPESGALEAVCKCISGFSDQFYKDLLKRFPSEGLPEKCNKTTPLGFYDTGGLRPDFWFLPCEVWEIRGADITLSPVYPAASSQLGSERGLSIRFPRFMKIREDKTWEQATTSEQFAEMYRKQIKDAPTKDQSSSNQNGNGKVEEIIRRDSDDEDIRHLEDEGEADEVEDED
ncbi:DNA ligase 1 [Kwoniella mangroviensis CBS 10435]|uniref:DNA ligase 1 n=1 Tax=Kwoniella mangroviensis CBS 10435 TaxID=1331196 RepID=A0A1B9IR55_9TREE|nr:DNA ligase 1 [Kwoniella mangroviensis CBS 10435]OCF74875.1 DNA ligase 1 [Kwoniella mangroviensis CBS 8886]